QGNHAHAAGGTTTNATGNTNGKKRVKRDTQKPQEQEHPLKSVNEQIKTAKINTDQVKTATKLICLIPGITDLCNSGNSTKSSK
ncbi:MAG: hypothetical protein NKF39_04185, partial [Tropheryma whipplei]|nr:hypothetical protein [Tropheryma whipplei]